MMSKKDMLTLGLLAAGGIVLASQIQDEETSLLGGGGFMPMGGVVTPSAEPMPAPIVYQFPPEAAVIFPEPPSYPSFAPSPVFAPSPISDVVKIREEPTKKKSILPAAKPISEMLIRGQVERFTKAPAKKVAETVIEPITETVFWKKYLLNFFAPVTAVHGKAQEIRSKVYKRTPTKKKTYAKKKKSRRDPFSPGKAMHGGPGLWQASQ